MLGIFVQILGALLILAALIDVFLTVLYARIGTGIMTPYLTYTIWRLFRFTARFLPRNPRDILLSACAPIMLISIVVLWGGTLSVGMALIVWPAFGKQITSFAGPTPTDFLSALSYSMSTTTTVGTGDLVANTPFFRILSSIQSLMGMTIITLTITYLLQIYTALKRRNTFALCIHHQTSATGDAIELVRGLGAAGGFDDARQEITGMANSLIDLYESHHVFWIVTYFRFREPYYALSRIALVIMESMTLIRSALSERKYAWLLADGAVMELFNAGMHLLTEFADVFLPKPPSGDPEDPDSNLVLLWRMRYREAIMKFHGAGIETAEDLIAGEEQYIKMRREWDRYIRAFSEYMAHTAEETDPAGTAMQASINQYPIEPARLRAAG